MEAKHRVSADANAVEDFLATLLDDEQVKASRILIKMMSRISGHEPKLWYPGIIGFDTYHYKYESGREGDSHPIGFAPRKDKITIYLMDGTVRYPDLLAKLGKHKTSVACLYIRRLSDVDVHVLEQIVQQAYTYMKSLDGHMHRAVE